MRGDKAKKKMLDRYSSRLMSQGGNRKQYLDWVQAFLDYMEEADFHDEDVTRKKVQGFMKKMERERHYVRSSQRLLWMTIRSFFSRNLLPWPFGRGEAPQILEPEIKAPAIAPRLVLELIAVTREKGTPKQNAFLALSTTYGMRPIEMRQLKATDINLKDQVIYVETAKHGRARSHSIPDVIIPVLSEYDFNQSCSESGMSMVWYEIEILANVDHFHHMGFHSVRRTLDTLLLRYFQEGEVKTYLRWKQKGGQNMTMVYSSTVFVDRDGVEEQIMKPQLSDLDARIFAKHPFLEAWR